MSTHNELLNKDCGVVCGVCKPILVYCFGQAEQNASLPHKIDIYCLMLKNTFLSGRIWLLGGGKFCLNDIIICLAFPYKAGNF